NLENITPTDWISQWLANSTRRPSFRSLAQLAKQTLEILQLIVGIQTAGIGKHPKPCIAYSFLLLTDLDFRLAKRFPVGFDAQDGNDARAITAHLSSQNAAALDEIFISQFGRRRGRVRDNIGDAYVVLQ